MRPLLAVGAVAGALALPGAAPASHHGSPELPDRTDCGGDRRDWFDLQVDVDYPVKPPAAIEPVLAALGCPSEGEPDYGPGPFTPPRREPPEPRSGASNSERAQVAPQLRLSVTPRRVRVGKRVRFRIRTIWVADGARRPAARVPIRLAGRRARTDRTGRASVIVRPRRAGKLRVTAYQDKRPTVRRTIRVSRRRASSPPARRRAGRAT